MQAFDELNDPGDHHPDERTNQCPYCTKVYKVEKTLKEHIKFIHDKDYKFVCELCGQGFLNKNHYRAHIDRHNNVKQYECTHCKKRFVAMSDLKRHIMYKHRSGIKPKYFCTEDNCSKVFKASSALCQHIKCSHRKGKKYVCEICGKYYYYKSNYNRHKQRKHKFGSEIMFTHPCGNEDDGESSAAVTSSQPNDTQIENVSAPACQEDSLSTSSQEPVVNTSQLLISESAEISGKPGTEAGELLPTSVLPLHLTDNETLLVASTDPTTDTLAFNLVGTETLQIQGGASTQILSNVPLDSTTSDIPSGDVPEQNIANPDQCPTQLHSVVMQLPGEKMIQQEVPRKEVRVQYLDE